MQQLPHFLEHMARLSIGPPPQHIVLGLSGGLDSVVLAHALVTHDYAVTAVHINYRLRGEASEADALFVQEYCRQLGISCHVEVFEAQHITPNGDSLQAFARSLRYRVFARIAHTVGASFVAVAHHADDQAETMILNLLRGTGIEGLAGMPPQRPLSKNADVWVIRPLLSYRKRELIQYARKNQLTWREDTSNHHLKYRRNVVRQRLMSIIKKDFGDKAIDHMVATMNDLRDYLDYDFYTKLSALFEVIQVAENALRLKNLNDLPAVWRKRLYLEALKRWLPTVPQTRNLLSRVDLLLVSQPGTKLILPNGIILRDRETIVFMKDVYVSSDTFQLRPGMPCETPWGLFEMDILYTDDPEELRRSREPNTEIWAAPPENTVFQIRAWAIGDHFRPFGMKGHSKKMSDFLTDAKIPAAQRKHIPVFLAGSEIWAVLGQRPCESARITPQTKQVLRLRWLPPVTS
ncbi:MAG TPA: tRNA lysidine(34) synthetase TilS [Bacteroidetes bacterium]|nr:tRNA lysidine(34) synthetase TilS [Bacteroidota bacterium]HRR08784.1 tRNA lysidine(34) synthetase TilS [Rhodothermales bacterium]